MVFDLTEEMVNKIIFCLDRHIKRLEKRIFDEGGNYKMAKSNAQAFIDVKENIKLQMKNMVQK